MAIRKILHISDLHFNENHEKESLLQKPKYVNDWIESLKEFDNLDTLIISGDIVDQGGSERIFDSVNLLIKRLKTELGIQHILCVPGNHDVNRGLLNGISGDKDIDPQNLWQYYDIKLKYYWDFVNKNKLNFNQNTGLVSYEILENPNIILLGLDSTNLIGIYDNFGSINVEKMRESLQKLFGQPNEKYKDYTKIAILHHRPLIYKSNSQALTENNSCKIGDYGTCDLENWQMVKKILLEYDVHYVLTGHVHGSQSEQVRPFDTPNDTLNYSTVGSIGVDFSKELQDHLDPNKDKTIIENLKELRCHGSLHGNHNAYTIWTFSDNGLVQEEQYKYIIDEGERSWRKWTNKTFEEENTDIQESIFDTKAVALPTNNTPHENYEEKILDCVRTFGLYKTGHYHWKNSARLNWIDTSYFFQHNEMLYYIARGINELFENNNPLKTADCIIGLGIKGSILLSYIRFLFPEKKCTYLPENQKEYNCYEMELFGEHEKINTIAVLTDVVHSGNTIKNFAKELHNRFKEFLNIAVVTIFDATPNGKIADVRDQVKFSLYSLAKLKVTDCQWGCENCDIYIKKLTNVIEYKED